jgi:hypothetical protein
MTFHLAAFETPAHFRRLSNRLSRKRRLLTPPGDCNIRAPVFAASYGRSEFRRIATEPASARKIARDAPTPR